MAGNCAASCAPYYDFPLLMLTAKGDTNDRSSRASSWGRMTIWSSRSSRWNWWCRVKALLKRYRIATSQTVRIGKLFMDRKTFEVKAVATSITPAPQGI